MLETEEGRGGRNREKQRNIDMMFYLFMYLLVDFYLCPDRGLNLQPWHTEMMH